MAKKIYKCDICGHEGNSDQVRKCHGMRLCSKHRNQIEKHNRITDSSSIESKERNKFIIENDYAIMIIHSKKVDHPIHVKIDIDDIKRVSVRKWNILIQGKSINVFASFNNKTIKLSRYLLNYDGELFVDHINRDTLDNRKCNLRIVTPAENSQNRGVTGLYKTPSGKWKAIINYFGKRFYVGTFKTKEQALEAKIKLANKIQIESEQLQSHYNITKERNIQQLGNKWTVNISEHGKRKYIGIFETLNDAIKARDLAESLKIREESA